MWCSLHALLHAVSGFTIGSFVYPAFLTGNELDLISFRRLDEASLQELIGDAWPGSSFVKA
jgi:hypothetical protein